MELLNEIMPLEEWKAKYDPVVADTIKFTPGFNKTIFEEKSDAFLKEYLHLVAKNPVKALKAYLLATLGFWDISESSPTAYISNFHFGNADYFMSDYFDYYFHFSFAKVVEPKKYISGAIMVWLLLFTLFECLSKKNYKGLIPLVPTLGIWMTIMLATPIANSFRYVYALFLCIPLYLLTLLDCNQMHAEQETEQKEIEA